MSPNTNKARLFGAIMTLLTAGTICVSAQTPAAVNGPKDNPESIREIRTTASEKKSGTLAASTDSTAAPQEVLEAQPRVEHSDSVRATSDVKVAASVSDEERGASVKARSASPQAASSDEWEFQVSPYFWLAGLHGTGGIGNRDVGVDMSFGDVFGSLNFALMGLFEARKGRWLVLTDVEFVSISDDKATPGPLFSDVNATFKTFIFDPEVGYRLYDDPDSGASVDVLGGIRVWRVSMDLDFGAGILPATEIGGSRTWVDGIFGIRGKAAVSEKVFVTGKFDLGGGGSNFTWQLFGGLGYSITPKIALIGGYRVLDVNYRKDNFIYDMNQRGPIVGLGFKF